MGCWGCWGYRAVRLGGVLIALILAPVPLSLAQPSASPSFVLHQTTVNSAGQQSSSASYRVTSSTGQATTVGASSAGTRFVLQSGFWSFAGSTLVPVVLAVSLNPVEPDKIDLSWSGNNAPYSVYQSEDCGGVLDSLFDTTTANDYAAIPSLGVRLECFNVLATAPGPAP